MRGGEGDLFCFFWDLVGLFGIWWDFMGFDWIFQGLMQLPTTFHRFQPFQVDGLEHFQGFLGIEWDFLGSDGILWDFIEFFTT